MKKLLLVSFMVLSTYLCHSQTKTTWEDYYYITKGLLDDESHGRAIKQGYSKGIEVAKKDSFTKGVNRNVTVYQFINPERKPIAYLFDCDDNQNKRYLCVPAAGSDKAIVQQCYNDLMLSGTEWVEIFTWVLMQLAGRRI